MIGASGPLKSRCFIGNGFAERKDIPRQPSYSVFYSFLRKARRLIRMNGAGTFPMIAQMTDEQFMAAGISRKIGTAFEHMCGGESGDY